MFGYSFDSSLVASGLILMPVLMLLLTPVLLLVPVLGTSAATPEVL